MTTLWVPSPNFTVGRTHHVVAIVDHIMAGTLAGADAWFSNPVSQVSAHYGVGKHGEVHQYVREQDTAWHAGILNHPDTLPWITTGNNPNAYTIGIEHEGQPQDIMPEAQYQATLALHRDLIARYAIPIDLDYIVGHYRFDHVNRPNCPGPQFPWDRLLADLTTPEPPTPTPEPPTPTPPQEDPMTDAEKSELRNIAAGLRARRDLADARVKTAEQVGWTRDSYSEDERAFDESTAHRLLVLTGDEA